jgi:hypothetical protein
MAFRKKLRYSDVSLSEILSNINVMVRADRSSAQKAIHQLESLVSKIFNYNFDFNNQMTQAEHEFFCEILNVITTKYRYIASLHLGGCLLRARYWSRQCEVEKALGFYEKVEAQYPLCSRAYRLHENLLLNEGRDQEAEAVRLKFLKAMAEEDPTDDEKVTLAEPSKTPPKVAEQAFSLFHFPVFPQYLPKQLMIAPAPQADSPRYELFPRK